MFEISNRLKTRVKGRLLVAPNTGGKRGASCQSTPSSAQVSLATAVAIWCKQTHSGDRQSFKLNRIQSIFKISIPLARQQAQLNEKVGCDYIKDNRVL